MKKRNYSCELVTEYAKELVWDEHTTLINNQIHLFSEQFRRQLRLVNKVDYIITDCPLLLNSIYMDHYGPNLGLKPEFIKSLKQVFDDSYFQFHNSLYYLKRETKYESEGRIQSKEDALKIDKAIEEKLDYYGLSYYTIDLKNGAKGILSKHGVYTL